MTFEEFMDEARCRHLLALYFDGPLPRLLGSEDKEFARYIREDATLDEVKRMLETL